MKPKISGNEHHHTLLVGVAGGLRVIFCMRNWLAIMMIGRNVYGEGLGLERSVTHSQLRAAHLHRNHEHL